MKVPLGWLREYVDVDLPLAELVERLTIAGLEVAGVRFVGLPVPERLPVKVEEPGPVWPRDKIVAAQVLKVERHPDAHRLTLCTVDYGAAAPKVVVTGAPNIKVGDQGQKVVVALSGSVLYDGHASEKKLSELKPTKIRGVPSDSMVCSAYELGISEEHEGILFLGPDAKPGTPLVDLLGEVVIEIDVLPNMARCLSMIGVAREVAALTGKKLRLPAEPAPAKGEPLSGKVSVAIEEPRLSARYAAYLIRGVTVGPSPGWMQRRLAHAGMRPISNLVDVTNYVMLEWGQPLHAFDYDALVRRGGGKPPAITVRAARPGEVLTTLDNQKRELTADNLVIADAAGPIALAGVMGGLDTECSPQTKNVLLESANFDFVSVRRTMKQFNLPSEASVRFSRGVHPEIVSAAGARAADLLRQAAGGTVASGVAETYPAPLPVQPIDLSLTKVRRFLGMDFPKEEAVRILGALEFKVEPVGADGLKVTPPPHRLDLQAGAADLIEELARIHGYDRMPATLLADALPQPHPNPLEGEERVRDLLVQAEVQEVITYSLTAPEREAALRLPPTEYIRLANPISRERVVMRHSLLPGLLEVAAGSLRHTDRLRLFEVGSVYLPRAGERLPDEPRRLALLLTGPRTLGYWADGPGVVIPPFDFHDLKGLVEGLLGGLHVADVGYKPASVDHLHPGRSAEVLLGGRSVGSFGQLHPQVADAVAVSGPRPVLVAELDLDAILAAVPARHPYVPVPRFPAALRDIAVIVDDALSAERVTAEIRAGGGNLLRAVRLFDLYKGESIPAGKKSLAYSLTYLADERTLTDKEVDKAHKRIEDRLRHVLQAQVRGKD